MDRQRSNTKNARVRPSPEIIRSPRARHVVVPELELHPPTPDHLFSFLFASTFNTHILLQSLLSTYLEYGCTTTVSPHSRRARCSRIDRRHDSPGRARSTRTPHPPPSPSASLLAHCTLALAPAPAGPALPAFSAAVPLSSPCALPPPAATRVTRSWT